MGKTYNASHCLSLSVNTVKKYFKILFVSTSFDDETRSKTINVNSHYPLGLAYLHSYLEMQGHKIKTLFLNDYPSSKCYAVTKQTIAKYQPGIVGFNILTGNRVTSFYLIEYIHKKYPKKKILIGGIHATVMHKQIIRKYPFVICITGEGEITTKILLEKMIRHKSYKRVWGIAYWQKGKVIITRSRPRIANLDTLPFPKHEIFFTSQRTVASILTSRGCPFHCSFCVLESISRRLYRKRSINNVMKEIQFLTKRYPQLETVWIHDDQFFLDNQRVIEFCDSIVKQNIKLRFICSGRFKPVSKEMVAALEKAGFVEVLFGLESGSPKVLDLCHKMITRKDVVETVRLFKNTRIFIVTFLIVGLYGETEATVKEGCAFIQKIQKIKYIFYYDIGILGIYPGTEIYDIAEKAGMIDDSYWLTDKPVPLFTVEHSLNELQKYKNIMLDHISMVRYLTPRGFISQFAMTLYILKFLWSVIPQMPMIISHLTQRFYPDVYFRIRKMIKNYRVNA